MKRIRPRAQGRAYKNRKENERHYTCAEMKDKEGNHGTES